MRHLYDITYAPKGHEMLTQTSKSNEAGSERFNELLTTASVGHQRAPVYTLYIVGPSVNPSHPRRAMVKQ